MTMSDDLSSTPSLSMKLDAFVFNGEVCSGGISPDDKRAKVTPIAQPNFAFLRLYDAPLI